MSHKSTDVIARTEQLFLEAIRTNEVSEVQTELAEVKNKVLACIAIASEKVEEAVEVRADTSSDPDITLVQSEDLGSIRKNDLQPAMRIIAICNRATTALRDLNIQISGDESQTLSENITKAEYIITQLTALLPHVDGLSSIVNAYVEAVTNAKQSLKHAQQSLEVSREKYSVAHATILDSLFKEVEAKEPDKRLEQAKALLEKKQQEADQQYQKAKQAVQEKEASLSKLLRKAFSNIPQVMKTRGLTSKLPDNFEAICKQIEKVLQKIKPDSVEVKGAAEKYPEHYRQAQKKAEEEQKDPHEEKMQKEVDTVLTSLKRMDGKAERMFSAAWGTTVDIYETRHRSGHPMNRKQLDRLYSQQIQLQITGVAINAVWARVVDCIESALDFISRDTSKSGFHGYLRGAKKLFDDADISLPFTDSTRTDAIVIERILDQCNAEIERLENEINQNNMHQYEVAKQGKEQKEWGQRSYRIQEKEDKLQVERRIHLLRRFLINELVSNEISLTLHLVSRHIGRGFAKRFRGIVSLCTKLFGTSSTST